VIAAAIAISGLITGRDHYTVAEVVVTLLVNTASTAWPRRRVLLPYATIHAEVRAGVERERAMSASGQQWRLREAGIAADGMAIALIVIAGAGAVIGTVLVGGRAARAATPESHGDRSPVRRIAFTVPWLLPIPSYVGARLSGSEVLAALVWAIAASVGSMALVIVIAFCADLAREARKRDR